MSGSDPFDPFGRDDHTIILPNPGGRRPVPTNMSIQPQSPYLQPSYPSPEQASSVSDAGATRLATPTAPPQNETNPSPVLSYQDMPTAPGENPVLSAAGPILMLLGRLRVALAHASFSQLMERVTSAIQRFDADVVKANVPADQAKYAKYALCATADDIVQNIPEQDRWLYTQYSMLSRFFGERTGGIRFFEELDRIKQDPILNYNVLELQHACLALGFQGVHRTSAGGMATLQSIQRAVYETLRRVKPRAHPELSPRWRGQDMAALRVPFWAAASFAGLFLLALFLTLRSLLGGGTQAVIDDVDHIFPSTDISIERRTVQIARPAPPPPIKTTQLERIRAALAQEIEQQKLSVAGTPTAIAIRVGSFISFEPGKADVIDAFLPLAQKIAQALDKEPGPITITGHSDKTPIKTVRFASNYELSVERAKAVGALIAKSLGDPNRIVANGKGDTAPLASNETVEGRARNRRVDVQIPHEH